MKLIIIRHAETVQNQKKILQGRGPGHLSKEGKIQAKKISQRLIKEEIDKIYCSDTERCKETISPLLEKNNIPLKVVEDLMEIDWGEFTGKPIYLREKYILENNIENKFKFKYPGGESFDEMKERVINFLNKIIIKEKGKTILLVTHSAPKRVLIMELLKKDIKHYEELKPHNTAMTIFQIEDNGNHQAKIINSINHL
tara:strand:- start:2076 stop:2669 length:594 start_codon:yes stop_codon:yes gene_type:complete